MSINQVTISGNLTRDCEVRHAASKDVCSFTVAVNDSWNDGGEWKDRTNYIDCDYWVSSADKVAPMLSKGAKVAVSGKLRWSQWEKDGQKRSKVTVTASSVEFMSKAGESEQPASEYDEDIPF